MGVQPPSDGIEEEPDVVEFGIAALDARVERLDIEFPVQARTLADRHGDVTIPIDAAGTEITLREAVEAAGPTEFDSEQDLLNALHPVFEAKRSAASRSLLARLRSLMPF
jgi:hypothetical protein